MSLLLLYFDYVVIMFVDECVIWVMVECFGYQVCFGNFVLNFYVYGCQVWWVVEWVREQVVVLVGVSVGQIVWIFGVIEFNNLVFKGVVQVLDMFGYLIISCLEYKVVLDIVQ